MVELVVVLVVAGIVSAVALPRLSQMGSFNDVAYRDQIKAMVAYARKAAVARRRYTCVTFNASSVGSLTAELVTPDAHAGSCATYSALKLPTGASSVSPPSNVTITSPALPLTIQFSAEGKPTLGGGTTIVVTSSNTGSTSSLTIESDSGYVH